MRKPKPPTPRSVSATLRTAGFRAIGAGTEGYEVAWHGDGPGVHLVFIADDGDDSTAAHVVADRLRDEALVSMAATLRRKGWHVEQRYAYLIVTGG
jgi:hypothetical protein